MNLLGRIFGFRPSPRHGAPHRALDVLCSYGLTGYARIGRTDDRAQVWSVDGRRLAEGGFAAWIRQMTGYLISQGVVVARVEHLSAADGIRVAINGRRFLVCPHRSYVDCETALVCAVKIVNQLLEEAGSDEQGYVLHTGDDCGLAVFMTAAVYERLCREPSLRQGGPVDVGTYGRPSRAAAAIIHGGRPAASPSRR